MGPEVARLRAVVAGRVQMVGFRVFVLRRAADLTGTVSNLADGTVECIVEGPRAELEALLDDLRQGPPAARVENVDVHWEAPNGSLPPMRVTV